MRVLTIEEMMMVSGGHYTDKDGSTHLDTISISRDGGGRSDSAGGDRGHSVAYQTNRDGVTGYVVLPGGEADKKPRLSKDGWVVDSVGVQVGVPGISGSISVKPREAHGGSSYN